MANHKPSTQSFVPSFKHMIFRLTILMLGLFLTLNVIAQEPPVLDLDSLEQAFTKMEDDTAKVNQVNKVVEKYTRQHTELMYSYAVSMSALADELGYLEGKAKALTSLGKLSRLQGSRKNAFIYLDSALEIHKSIDDPSEKIRTHYELAVVYNQASKPDEALKQFDQALQILIVQKDSSRMASVYNSMVQSYNHKGLPDSARYFGRKAIYLAEKTKSYGTLTSVFTNMGVSFSSQQITDSALFYYQKGIDVQLELGEQQNKRALAILYGNIGNIHRNRGDYFKAIEIQLQALEMNRQLGRKLSEAIALAGIGQVYGRIKDYETQLHYLEQSAAIFEELEPDIRYAIILGDIGTSLHEIGRSEEGIEKIRKAISLAKSNRCLTSNLQIQLAQTFYKMEKYDSAEVYFELAYPTTVDCKRQNTIAASMAGLGKIALYKKQYKKAESYLLKADSINLEQNLLDQHRAIGINLYKLYKATGDLDKALFHLEEARELADTLYSKEKARELSHLEFKHELALKENAMQAEQQKQEALYEKELEKQRLIQLTALIGVALTLVILIILYRSYLIKKRKNQQLSEKNIEISNLREKEKKMADETIALKERELTTITMLSYERNSLLQQLGDQIGGLSSKVDEEVIPDLKEIKKTIKANLSEESWSTFVYHFEKVHPKLFDQLKSQFPSLTQNDMRLCAYIRVGMERKEMATLTNVTPEAIKKSLYRLKKKMNLGPEDDLTQFITKISAT